MVERVEFHQTPSCFALYLHFGWLAQQNARSINVGTLNLSLTVKNQQGWADIFHSIPTRAKLLHLPSSSSSSSSSHPPPPPLLLLPDAVFCRKYALSAPSTPSHMVLLYCCSCLDYAFINKLIQKGVKFCSRRNIGVIKMEEIFSHSIPRCSNPGGLVGYKATIITRNAIF